MKPRGTNNAAENAIAFVPTNSTSRVSAKNLGLSNPKVAAPKNKSTVETMPILNFNHAS
ncbi:hypothetical protein [Vibrio parahaemolyticus]|uniref:hypothetical protein n=1 Tax=Vibrio parahaemolyticus TaxID=670 RepID=UPI0023629713|nr:hypothetical protein [Vibrio parahaemolyticus]